MGEYATYRGAEIKIGTCEQMYYLRADQAELVTPLPHSVHPVREGRAGTIRFRFPFPDEDGIAPGAFEDYDRGLRMCPVRIDAEALARHEAHHVDGMPADIEQMYYGGEQ